MIVPISSHYLKFSHQLCTHSWRFINFQSSTIHHPVLLSWLRWLAMKLLPVQSNTLMVTLLLVPWAQVLKISQTFAESLKPQLMSVLSSRSTTLSTRTSLKANGNWRWTLFSQDLMLTQKDVMTFFTLQPQSCNSTNFRELSSVAPRGRLWLKL